jgi:hypothetical protein
VIGDHRLSSTQGEPRGGFQICAHRRPSNNAFMPTDACAHQESIVRRNVF